MRLLETKQDIHTDVEKKRQEGLIVYRPADEATFVELKRSLSNHDT